MNFTKELKMTKQQLLDCINNMPITELFNSEGLTDEQNKAIQMTYSQSIHKVLTAIPDDIVLTDSQFIEINNAVINQLIAALTN